MKVKRVVIYARLSVAVEQSVSIQRQLASARMLAESRGWEVVDEFVDDGVSASRSRPEDRKGWGALLATSEPYDAVVVWKIDRLARRVLDFLNAHKALEARGAGIVAVDDPLDMTTPQGRIFATILAAFGEMEAEAISARVKAARRQLIADGRVPGGRLPYGWTSEKRGAGRYLVKNPDTIGYVERAARMVLEGRTVTAVCKWLDSEGAPLPPSKGRKSDRWNFSTIDGLLRNPVLAGMTLSNPGNGSKIRGIEVKRDQDGMPVINPGVAILTPAEHRRLLELLDAREQPRTTQSATSVFFSRLASCGDCARIMHRTRKGGREALVCPGCSQTVATAQLKGLLVARLLDERGHLPLWEHAIEAPDIADLRDVEHAIAETTARMGDDDADVAVLLDRLDNLKALRAKARSSQPQRRYRMTRATVKEAWEAARGDVEQREVFAAQLASLRLVRGRVGRRLDPDRVRISWHPERPDAIVLPDGRSLSRVDDGTLPEVVTIGGIIMRWNEREATYVE